MSTLELGVPARTFSAQLRPPTCLFSSWSSCLFSIYCHNWSWPVPPGPIRPIRSRPIWSLCDSSRLVPSRSVWSRPIPSRRAEVWLKTGGGPAQDQPWSGLRPAEVRHKTVQGPAKDRPRSGRGLAEVRPRTGIGPAQERPRSGNGAAEIRVWIGRGLAQDRPRSGPRQLKVRTETGQGLGRVATDCRSMFFECDVFDGRFHQNQNMFGSALVSVELLGNLRSTLTSSGIGFVRRGFTWPRVDIRTLNSCKSTIRRPMWPVKTKTRRPDVLRR